MTLFLLYLALQADSISVFLGIFSVVTGFSAVGLTLFYFGTIDFDRDLHCLAAKLWKRLVPAFILIWVVTAMFPSTKTLLILGGAHAAMETVEMVKENPNFQAIPDNLAKVINKTLEDYIQEDAPSK